MARTSNKKYPFPTLDKNREYNGFDKKSVAERSYPLQIGHYYCKLEKGIEICTELTEDHFSDKRYKKVTEGSQRWWLYERRRFDYNWFQKISNPVAVSNTKIKEHEQEWQEFISCWYSTFEKSLGISTKSEPRQLSLYKLNKEYSNDDILELVDAMKIGRLEDGTPKNYTLLKDDNGETYDIQINYSPKSVQGVTKFSRRWWEIERVKYDKGDICRPVYADFGMLSSDWRGVEYKFLNGLHNIASTDIVTYHERGWIQFCQATYYYKYMNQQSVVSSNTKYHHNVSALMNLEDSELNEIAVVCPELILDYMPPAFYKSVFLSALTLIENKRALNRDQRESIAMIRDIISKVRTFITTPPACTSIHESTAILAAENLDKNGSIMLLYYLANMIERYNMLPRQYSYSLSVELTKFPLMMKLRESCYDSSVKYGIDEKGEWITKVNLSEIFEQWNREIDNVYEKYGIQK